MLLQIDFCILEGAWGPSLNDLCEDLCIRPLATWMTIEATIFCIFNCTLCVCYKANNEWMNEWTVDQWFTFATRRSVNYPNCVD